MDIQTPTAAKPAILIVDDDPALCSSLKFALELEGFAVSTYGNAAALLADPAAAEARCLVIDYRLPGMNGLDLLQRLRARGLAAPAILITTNPGRLLYEAAERAGTRIIEKPLLTNALSDAIRRALAAPA